jgi:short-chain fatty acids transporter
MSDDKSRTRVERAFQVWARLLERLFPDPFTLSLLLTLVTLVVARLWTPHSVGELVSFWGSGLWSFLAFAMQMALILVTGQALAEAPIVANLLARLSSGPQTMSGGVALVSFCAMVAAWLNWGFGLIVGALLARQVADSLAERFGEEVVSRGLLGAAGYAGLAFWHGGLSGSAPLTVAEKGHFLEEQIGVVPLQLTVLSGQNLWLSLALLLLVPAFLVGLNRLGLASTNQPVEPRPHRPESRAIEPSERLLVVVMSLLALAWWVFYRDGLGLNSVIFGFLFLGLLAHGSASLYAGALDRATSGISGIVLQFPFYAGIVGMASESGLVGVVSAGFVTASQSVQETLGFQPFLLFVFLSAGLANLFVPSGGGQWMIQGPIVLSAAKELGIDAPDAILAVSYGDQWTNLLQPFWALPLLSITGLKPAQLLSITTLLLLWVGCIVGLALILF